MTTSLPHLTAIPYAVFANPATSVLLPIALGTTIGFSTRPSQTQATYGLIKQPPLRPPPAVFGPVWTLLYGLMGYAAHRAITALPPSHPLNPPNPLQLHIRGLYTLQLALNLLWMPLFFGARRPRLALADVVALLGVNGYLTRVYFAVDRSGVAGWCQVPYLVWLGFATYLTAGVGYLNGWDISEASLARRGNKRKE
ncbi:putative translocator protein like protein [Whalleya microplaca]|nr:putative translocator protein like protein [Whalleya microplaca]